MKRKTVYIIFVVILLIILFYIINRISRKEYNSFSFPSTMIVKNYSNNRMSDTISMIILNKIMNIDTILIEIYPIKINIDTDDYIIDGFLIKDKFNKHNYDLFLKNDVDFKTLKIIISHEMIHLTQYESNRLDIINNDIFIWDNSVISFSDIDYMDRPYEIEAFKNTNKIYKQLNDLLYK